MQIAESLARDLALEQMLHNFGVVTVCGVVQEGASGISHDTAVATVRPNIHRNIWRNTQMYIVRDRSLSQHSTSL